MIIITIFLFVIGAIFGSFFNVCIYRIPLKKSIVYPASYCPVCKTPIKPIHNIPLLSYIFLKGRCAYCKAKIPPRYFFVELISALLFVLAFKFNKQRIDFILLKHLIFISFSIIIFFIDFDRGIIPDVLSFPLMALGLVFAAFNINIKLLHSILGGLVIFLILMLISYLCEKIKKRDCIGGGDLKFLAAIGFYFGILPSFFILFIASVLALFYIIISKKNMKKSFPFGPFISMSAVIYIFVGKELIGWYIKYFIGNSLF